MTPELTIGQNAKLPRLVCEVAGISTLAGATSLVFHFWKKESNYVVKTGVAALYTDGSDLKLKYEWPGATDTATDGDHEGYFTGNALDGKPFRAPSGRNIQFHVTKSP
jgi:hypothetical protein